MTKVIHRGPQYFLLIVAILLGICLAIFLSPKQPKTTTKEVPVNDKKSKKTITEKAQERDAVVDSSTSSTFDKVIIESRPEVTESSMDAWYQSLLKDYTSGDENISNYHGVVIRYYRKPIDMDKVDSLKSIGFYIHERPTKRELTSFYTNTIYYGDSVRREDILVVAYQLRMAGIKLQAIEHSRFGDNWKSHSIELGTDTTVLDMPELTLDTIRYIVENNQFIKTRM